MVTAYTSQNADPNEECTRILQETHDHPTEGHFGHKRCYDVTAYGLVCNPIATAPYCKVHSLRIQERDHNLLM